LFAKLTVCLQTNLVNFEHFDFAAPRKTLIDHRSVIRHGSPLPTTPPSRPANQPSPATSTATHLNTRENQQFLKVMMSFFICYEQ